MLSLVLYKLELELKSSDGLSHVIIFMIDRLNIDRKFPMAITFEHHCIFKVAIKIRTVVIIIHHAFYESTRTGRLVPIGRLLVL